VTGPRIAFVGGGSRQWIPTLVADVALTPSLHEAEIVLEDVDAGRLPQVEAYVEHVARGLGTGITVRSTTDQLNALDGADFVVVCVSTGGLESMRFDLEVPVRHGITMPHGDTVGPSGICRSLRNVPVLLDVARDMEAVAAPGAWMLNLTNPMTVLCRAVARETAVPVVGLCHEVTIMQGVLCGLLGARAEELDVLVAGVNHLPVVTEVTVDGAPRLLDLRDALDDERWRRTPVADDWDRGRIVDQFAPNFEMLRRFGALPAAGTPHTVEFFPDLVTAQSGWGARWGAHRTTVEERAEREAGYQAELDGRLATDEMPARRSTEMLAPVIDSLVTGRARHLPLNRPNAGQCPDLPRDAVVETICTVDREGIRGRDAVVTPPILAEVLRRVVASQELTVEAAVTGGRDRVFEALLADPLAGTLDWDALGRLTDDLIASTARWLPQFRTTATSG
jgi:alpha-galactosidase